MKYLLKLYDALGVAVFFLLCQALLLNLGGVEAFTMQNNNYIIRMGNVNSGAGVSEGGGNRLGITVGQTAPGLYSGTNYKVRAGFQYIHSIIPFTFTIAQTAIDFGVLSATNPVTRTNRLTVSNGSANGFAVTASENHQLLVPASGAVIPDTTCDNGLCTETASAAWTSTLTYGFGYRCDDVTGTNCDGGFAISDTYKQFADASNNELAQIVMSNANVGEELQSEITYKVNVSGTQPAGTYTNIITYIATPTF